MKKMMFLFVLLIAMFSCEKDCNCPERTCWDCLILNSDSTSFEKEICGSEEYVIQYVDKNYTSRINSGQIISVECKEAPKHYSTPAK